MERTVKRVEFAVPSAPNVTRVAAYARVSSGKDAMLHSLSAQVSYYSSLIQNHPGWLYCGVYDDEALTGTKERREKFQQLLEACRRGEVDMVITKSISRFARNTVTLLESVRELKVLGVDVYFEEQRIHTISAEGELMITILASYAQEESRSASENQKWRIQKNFLEGKPWNGVMLGYRQKDGKYVIVPEEAEIVRRIYAEYLSGKGVEAIAKDLNADQVLTRKGYTWHKTPISCILRNSNYTGNLLLQRYYSENHITKRKCANTGELPKYAASDTHEAIIDADTFEAVQREIASRAKRYTPRRPQQEQYPFTGMIDCGFCGKHYRRKVTAAGPVWICNTYNSKGKTACPSSQIREDTLCRLVAECLDLRKFREDSYRSRVTGMIAKPDRTLVFRLKDGTEKVLPWEAPSRRDSWTPEMRQKAREKRMSRQGSLGAKDTREVQ